MNKNPDREVLALTLSIPSSLVDLLKSNSSHNFMAEQPGRFMPIGDGELPLPNAPEFADGTLIWTDCMADAFLLRAYEQAEGELVTFLSDECDYGAYRGVVVLTSRSYGVRQDCP